MTNILYSRVLIATAVAINQQKHDTSKILEPSSLVILALVLLTFNTGVQPKRGFFFHAWLHLADRAMRGALARRKRANNIHVSFEI